MSYRGNKIKGFDKKKPSLFSEDGSLPYYISINNSQFTNNSLKSTGTFVALQISILGRFLKLGVEYQNFNGHYLTPSIIRETIQDYWNKAGVEYKGTHVF